MGIVPQRYDKPRDPLRVGANPSQLELGYAAGQLGYVQNNSLSQNVTAFPTVITGLTTPSIIIGANRRLKLTGKCHFASTAIDTQLKFEVQQDTVGQNASYMTFDVANVGQDWTVQAILTPAAGSHVYRLVAGRTSGAGTITAFAAGGGAATFAFILVEDIGAA